MRTGHVVMKLTELGFRFRLDGAGVKVRFEGGTRPDLDQVKPLLQAVKAQNAEVREFLRCFCPRCGGVVFCPDLEGRSRCLACDWA